MTRTNLNALRLRKESLLDIEDDSDNIDMFIDETPIDRLLNQSTTVPIEDDMSNLCTLDPQLNDPMAMKSLLSKYKERFRKELTPDAARLTPFELNLKPNSTWTTSRSNKGPPRQQSRQKEEAIQEFINNALKIGLIRESQSTEWSHILVTPKPNGKFRFCVDFRLLNESTESLGWPLPNIKQMLQRIGTKKSKYFAVLDLTQGYYQMAISKQSSPLTAFRTPTGLYEWVRLPMGLKGAPAYFQQKMQTVVLAELIQKGICEVYLDDIIVHAKSEEELRSHLDKVFQKLQAYNITVNPEKVKLGMKQIEYVGHTIDEQGLHFTRDKIEDVLATPKPITHKQLKSFLGLCVQFKDHINQYADIVKPLHKMIHNYSKARGNLKLSWTEETNKCFSMLLDAVNKCPKLFFLEEGRGEIFLHTDASQYGIGGYLFQVIQGKTYPIAFISKTLSDVELRWSTPEKEAYAIFYSLMKLEHLLRDTHFTLRTDHKNLTYINSEFREKVKRWKLAIQHFDFDIEYIKGPDNIEADGFSRLCPDPNETESKYESKINSMLIAKGLSHNCSLPKSENDITYLNSLNVKVNNHMIPADKYDIIKSVHNELSGHLGVDKTIEKLISIKKTWKNMRKDVETFIQRCDLCQKLSFRKIDIQTMPFTLASYSPFNRLYIDTIGPLKSDNEDKKFILVIIDAFSRYVELSALSNTEAVPAAEKILEWIGRFGIPSEIVSDNGTQFANTVVSELLDTIKSEDVKIQAYSKEENGIVERANKEVNRHVRGIVYNRKKRLQWYKYLPLVQRILNATVHKSIGVSPAQLVFGNSTTLDRQVIPLPEKSDTESYTQYIQDMLEAQAEFLKKAEETQFETDQFHIQKRMEKAKGKLLTEFPPGSYVLTNYKNTDNKPPTKFHTFLHGPFRVIGNDGPIYELQNLVTNEKDTYHIKYLHPFEYDSDKKTPEDIAKHDNYAKEEYFDIIEIKDHRFLNDDSTKTPQLLIHWEGEDTHRWSDLTASIKATEEFHKYARQHSLVRFIPPQFKWPKDHPDYEKPIRTKRLRENSQKSKKKRRKFGKY
jgi:hypothetical protein